MTSRCRVRLVFVPGGPAVTGYWDDPGTAERKFREQIGTYGSHPTVRITLDETRADGRWHTLAQWTRDGGERRTPRPGAAAGGAAARG